jgi:hypothetical protein
LTRRSYSRRRSLIRRGNIANVCPTMCDRFSNSAKSYLTEHELNTITARERLQSAPSPPELGLNIRRVLEPYHVSPNPEVVADGKNSRTADADEANTRVTPKLMKALHPWAPAAFDDTAALYRLLYRVFGDWHSLRCHPRLPASRRGQSYAAPSSQSPRSRGSHPLCRSCAQTPTCCRGRASVSSASTSSTRRCRRPLSSTIHAVYDLATVTLHVVVFVRSAGAVLYVAFGSTATT